MDTHYDKEANVLLIRISNNKPEYGEDIGKGIVVHFDIMKNKVFQDTKNLRFFRENKNPVEIEILDAKKYLADWVGQALEVKSERKIAA